MDEENKVIDEPGGIDLDKELAALTAGGYDPDQNTPVTQGSGFRELFQDKKKLFVIGGGTAGVVLLGVIGLLLFGGGKQAPATKSGDPQIQEADKNARGVFKASIQPAVNAQEAKGRIAEAWRKATVQYSKDQDLDAFKQTLTTINDERTEYLEKIQADDNKLNVVVINALNNQRQYLNQAFNADSSGSAVSIFNEWNSGDKAFDEEYIDTLKAQLTEIGIKYTVSKTDNKTTINY